MFNLGKLIAATVLSVGFLTAARSADVYDPAADFSFVDNPAGPWTYGYTTVLDGSMTRYEFSGVNNGLLTWALNNSLTPGVFMNPDDVDKNLFSTVFRARQINLHPGPAGEYSVVRFTAQTSGIYELVSSFNMRSSAGTAFTSNDVLLNGSSFFKSAVLGFNAQADFSQTILMSAGDKLDFIVGPNGSYTGDTTELRVTLVPVPEPGNYALLLAGLVIVGAATRRNWFV